MNIKILVGSLRKDSLNLLVAQDIALSLKDHQVEIVDLNLPLFNQDLEIKDAEPSPEVVRQFRDKIRQADLVIAISPEYDRLPSAIILNACHWLSRRPGPIIDSKPVFLIGVSSGSGATKNSRPALRLAFKRLGSNVLDEEVFVADGKDLLTDPNKRDQLDKEIQSKLASYLKK
jgi:chromate reductase